MEGRGLPVVIQHPLLFQGIFGVTNVHVLPKLSFRAFMCKLKGGIFMINNLLASLCTTSVQQPVFSCWH